ncbi:hypothetical protein BHS04_19830 [Myxococcus xanthus]|nr:hypothetical protein BHS04_19830 [Myxococcus xanthus]
MLVARPPDTLARGQAPEGDAQCLHEHVISGFQGPPAFLLALELRLIREGNAYMKFFSVVFGTLRQMTSGRQGASPMTESVTAGQT